MDGHGPIMEIKRSSPAPAASIEAGSEAPTDRYDTAVSWSR